AHDEVRPTAMRLPPRSFPASRPLLRMDLQSPGQDGKREAQLASRPALSGRHQTAPQTQGHAGQDGAPLANRFSSPGEASREYRLTSGCAAWSHYRLFSALRLPTVAYPACSPSLAPHRPPSGSRSDEKSGLVSAPTVKPQRTDLANESSTARRSAGLALDERNDSFPCTSSTLGPTRWNETILPPSSCPRSRPMSFDPSPAARPVANRKSFSRRGISSQRLPVRSSQYSGK